MHSDLRTPRGVPAEQPVEIVRLTRQLAIVGGALFATHLAALALLAYELANLRAEHASRGTLILDALQGR